MVLSGSVLSLLGVTMLYFRVPFARYDYVVLSSDLAPLVTVLTVVVLANAINLIDGLDGLAAGIVAIAGGAFFLYADRLFKAGLLEGSNIAPLVAIIAVGVCVGFLPHNLNPAKIIMGDAGALFLGLLMATTTITVGGRTADQFSGQTYFFFAPLFIPLVILGIPILDTAFSFFRRVYRRTAFHVADKDHLHHRLMRLGHTTRRTVVILWLWTALLSAARPAPHVHEPGERHRPARRRRARAPPLRRVPSRASGRPATPPSIPPTRRRSPTTSSTSPPAASSRKSARGRSGRGHGGGRWPRRTAFGRDSRFDALCGRRIHCDYIHKPGRGPRAASGASGVVTAHPGAEGRSKIPWAERQAMNRGFGEALAQAFEFAAIPVLFAALRLVARRPTGHVTGSGRRAGDARLRRRLPPHHLPLPGQDAEGRGGQAVDRGAPGRAPDRHRPRPSRAARRARRSSSWPACSGASTELRAPPSVSPSSC